jgi:8-oxo-dGTP pyrophosphatase MutT (NUDIX family)
MKWQKKIYLFDKWKRYIASFFWLSPCAWGICIRQRHGKTEILCIIHKDGSLMLPKWHIKKWETPPEAALREFIEETGMIWSVLREKIGILRDRKRRKKITFYAIEQIKEGPLGEHDEKTIWVDIRHAMKTMKHKSESHFLERYFIKK